MTCGLIASIALLGTAQFPPQETPKTTREDEIGVPGKDLTPAQVDVAREVLKFTNMERKAEKIDPLKLNWELSNVAIWKATDMATNNYFSHVDSKLRSPSTLVEESGFKDWRAVGENILGGAEDSKEALKLWMQSPGHKKAILDKRFQELGVGYTFDIKSKYIKYYVQIFYSK